MQYDRDSFWRGRDFTSLEQMQAAAEIWCRDVSGARTSRPLDGQQPGFVFSAVEQHALLPLPRNEFELAEWSSGKVATDCHVKVGKTLYSGPWRLIGQQVHARTCGDIVQIVHGGDVVATHATHHRGRAITVGDPSYRTVKGILAAGSELGGTAGPSASARTRIVQHRHR